MCKSGGLVSRIRIQAHDALTILGDVDRRTVVPVLYIVHQASHTSRHNVQPYRVRLCGRSITSG
jgi:hypothetical protein